MQYPEESRSGTRIRLYLAEMQGLSTSMVDRKEKGGSVSTTSLDIYLPLREISSPPLFCSISLPATPLLNKHVFESAYYVPDRLIDSNMAFNPQDRSGPSPYLESPSSQSILASSKTASSTPLDMSLLTDSSSMLDESLPALPSTPPCERIQPNIHAQTPRRASGLLLGLGVEGLFHNNGKAFDGMGLLSEQFWGFERGAGNETMGDGDEDQDTSPSKRTLREALLTFSRDGLDPPPKIRTDDFLVSSIMFPSTAFRVEWQRPATTSEGSISLYHLEPHQMCAKEV